MKLFIILLFIFCTIISYSYLTSPQFYKISNILSTDRNDSLTKEIQHNTRKILFYHSKPFAYKKFNQFVNSSRICSQFSYHKKNQMLFYSYMGLWKAVRNYNGRSKFYNYADIYIDSELKKGLTEIFGSSILPHRFRVNKSFREKNKDIYKKSFVLPLSFKEDIKNMKLKEDKRNIRHIFEIVDELSPTDRLYFKYRFNIYTGKVIRTNKHVAELMCVSEDKAVIELKRIRKEVTEKILKYS